MMPYGSSWKITKITTLKDYDYEIRPCKCSIEFPFLMLIYSFITDYQAFNLRYKDNTTRDKNETKVDKQSANLGKNNEPIQNRLSFLIDCKSVILHHLAILSFPMVRPAWDNWWFSKIRLPLQRISTAENFEGFYFAISWTELTKVDKSGQRLTDEREGKEQGSDLI